MLGGAEVTGEPTTEDQRKHTAGTCESSVPGDREENEKGDPTSTKRWAPFRPRSGEVAEGEQVNGDLALIVMLIILHVGYVGCVTPIAIKIVDHWYD